MGQNILKLNFSILVCLLDTFILLRKKYLFIIDWEIAFVPRSLIHFLTFCGEHFLIPKDKVHKPFCP